eukprot:8294513-Pyramimonas_sp.AAC.1
MVQVKPKLSNPSVDIFGLENTLRFILRVSAGYDDGKEYLRKDHGFNLLEVYSLCYVLSKEDCLLTGGGVSVLGVSGATNDAAADTNGGSTPRGRWGGWGAITYPTDEHVPRGCEDPGRIVSPSHTSLMCPALQVHAAENLAGVGSF